MLCLTIHKGNGIIVGGNVTITVERCTPQNVRVAIDAPLSVGIVRTDARQQAREWFQDARIVARMAQDLVTDGFLPVSSLTDFILDPTKFGHLFTTWKERHE